MGKRDVTMTKNEPVTVGARHAVPLLIALLVTIVAYIPTFQWMYDRWSVRDSYYSHGFLVPAIAAFIIWSKRKLLAGLKVEPSGLGWPILIAGVGISLISALWRVYFSSGFALLLILPGLVLLFLGKQYLRHLIFPISFLGFMIPLPLVAIVNISFKLKMAASAAAAFMLNSIGLEAVRDGSIIRTANAYLVVEDPCSGIRSLIALIALGVLMAYFTSTSRVKKAVLLVFTVPIAVGANVVRIVGLSVASEIYGTKFAMGFFHDLMGYLVFVIAFLLLTALVKILE